MFPLLPHIIPTLTFENEWLACFVHKIQYSFSEIGSTINHNYALHVFSLELLIKHGDEHDDEHDDLIVIWHVWEIDETYGLLTGYHLKV